MIKAKVIRPHPEYGYFPGDIGYFPGEKVEKLAKEGYIQPTKGYFEDSKLKKEEK